MIKALFFDIDGTLVSFSTHLIPQSAVKAITKAKEKGIKIYISTGRPLSLINNIDSIKHLIDGYITTNGAYCIVKGEVISCNPIPENDVLTVMRLADEMNFACMVVGENDLAVYNSNDKVDVIFRQMLNVQNLKENVPMEPILKQRILQLTPIISDAEERIIMPHLTGCISSRWYPDFIDITAQNVDKGYGLLSIAFHQGIKIEDTMAFGDGGNDIPIIKRAGIGIAMGNANQDLKEIADYITSSVDDNGIYNALKHFII